MTVKIGKEVLLQLYRTMLTIRYFEEKVSKHFAQGSIPGFVHLSLEQEGVAAGVCAHLKQDDYLVTNHRGHGHCIAKGADLKQMAAEIFGRSPGYCKGRGGSMHIMAPDKGILGANGIVAGGLPMAVGAAFSAHYRGTSQVAAVFFGDGASANGAFHEAVNLAAVWNLPVLFVCENNGWAEFSPVHVHSKFRDISRRAAGYGVEAALVDGDDVLAVYEQAGEMVERLRSGEGPLFLECKTHRWRGHYEGDPERYRPAEEKAQLQEHDPISRFEDAISGQGKVTAAEMDDCREGCLEEVEAAMRFALESPWPDLEEVLP